MMSYATNESYTTEKIMDLINNYPYYISRIKELRKRYSAEVGGGNTGQYGIEATLPKPQGNNTDPVHFEVQRLLKMDKELSRLEWKARYIQNRIDRIIDERMAMVLNLRLSGKTYQEISETVELTPQRVHQIIKDIALLLKD